ncbi:MAG TPA: spore coat U domain-containing protein [Solimonas sp.]|nr:spore coat U domain-containing protein [Solimonas sp.]
MRSRSLRALLLLALAALATPAHAVLATCTASAQTVAFGSYNPFSATPLDSSGQVGVSCSISLGISIAVSYTIKLSTGVAGSYAPRYMAAGANHLNYNLYTSSARTTVWGNGTGGTSTVTDSYLLGLSTVARTYPVYGRVTAQQNLPGGSYSDTIMVTVEY